GPGGDRRRDRRISAASRRRLAVPDEAVRPARPGAGDTGRSRRCRRCAGAAARGGPRLSEGGSDREGAPGRGAGGQPASRLLVALALIPTALIALPIIYVLLRSWGAGWEGILAELGRRRTLTLLANTVTLCLSVTIASGLIGFAVAWCTERSDLPGRRVWRVLCCLPLAMPAFVASFAWKSLGPSFQGMPGAILILTMESFPLIFLPVAAALRSMDPGMEEVSRSLG